MNAPDRTGQVWTIRGLGTFVVVDLSELSEARGTQPSSWFHPAAWLDDGRFTSIGEWTIGPYWEGSSTHERVT